MSAQASVGISDGEVAALLAAQGFDGSSPPVAIVLAAGESPAVIWANRLATALFGSTDPAVLTARLFGGRGRNGLADAVRHVVPGGGARTERLRLTRGLTTKTLTVLISRLRFGGEAGVTLLHIPAAKGTAADGDEARSNALEQPAVDKAMGDDNAPSVPPDAGVAAVGRRRFLWRTDANGRLVATTDRPDELASLDGSPSLTAGLLPDSEGRPSALADALATGRPWSGIAVLWPTADGRLAVPTILGAVPSPGQEGGFRGFAVADFTLASAAPAPAETPPAEAPSSDHAGDPAPVPGATSAEDQALGGAAPASPVDLPAFEPAQPDLPGDMPKEDEPAPVPAPQRPALASVRATFSSAKVVTLRPHSVEGVLPEMLPPGITPWPSRRKDDIQDSGKAVLPPAFDLSTVEQDNFDEIARTLKNGGTVPGTVGLSASDGAALLTALPVALMIERGGEPLYLNAAFATLTGYDSPEALAQAGGRRHLLGGLDAAEVTDAETDHAFPVIDAKGQVLSVQGRVLTLPWTGGLAEALMLRAATEPVAELQSLRLESRRWRTEAGEARALLDRVSDATATVDAQGRLLAVNAAAERLFGREAASLVGESIGGLLTPEFQSAALGAVFATGAGGQDAAETRITGTGRRFDGILLQLDLTFRPVSAGRIGVVFRNLSDTEALQEQALTLRAELDRAAETRAEFLAKVSHEIRTPLNAILGFAEIMLDERFGSVGNPKYKDYLGDIRAAGQHVIDLVNDLSDLSDLQAGRHELTVAATDVNRVIGESVAEAQSQAHRQRIIVRLSLMTNLPQALVDEPALRQVMDNVLSNAIRFNEPGGQVIVSTTVHEGGGIAVRVRDTGPGMSDTELAVAMEPFRQLGTDKPARGNGLGLPLTRALVEANQATLSITSRKNEGTLVEIVLRPSPDQPPATAPAA